MRVTSIRPGAVTGCDLGSGHWTLLVASTRAYDKPALSIKLRLPPAVPFLISPVTGQPVSLAEYHTMVLAAATIDLAEAVEELTPIASVATASGTLDADLQRTMEAMTMFKNKPRVREETFNRDAKDAQAIVTGYWQITDWLRAADRKRTELTICDATLVLEP